MTYNSNGPVMDAGSYLRYDPVLSVPDPNEAEAYQRIFKDIETYIRTAAAEYSKGVRAAHAKGYGGVKALMQIYDDLPEPYAQGIFAHPDEHEAIIRFSNGNAHLGPDYLLGAAVGMGLKILDVPGAKLLDPALPLSNFDLILINSPIFASNNVESYVNIQRLSFEKTDPKTALYNLLTSYGSKQPADWLWEELFAFVRLTKLVRQNLLLSSYWTMGAFRYGNHIAKLSLTPVAESAAKVKYRLPEESVKAEFYHDSLAQEIASRDYAFELKVQLAINEQATPINRLTIEWPEAVAPVIPVARITIPQQTLIDPSIIDRLSLNAWRVTTDHEPLGSLQRIRKQAYQVSQAARQKANHQTAWEPKSHQDIQ